MIRSENVVLCNMLLDPQSCYYYTRELGEMKIAHIVDKNENMELKSRSFVESVLWCQQLESKLEELGKFLDKENRSYARIDADTISAPEQSEFSTLQTEIEMIHWRMKEINTNIQSLSSQLCELTEYQIALNHIQSIACSAFSSSPTLESESQLLPETGILKSLLVGTIETKFVRTFEQIIWRFCHGNVFMSFQTIETPLEDSKTGQLYNKSLFVAFYTCEQLANKLGKIFECFPTKVYFHPSAAKERVDLIANLQRRILEVTEVVRQSKLQNEEFLNKLERTFHVWKIQIHKIKMIYIAMNKYYFDPQRRGYTAEFWCLEKEYSRIKAAIFSGRESGAASGFALLRKREPSAAPPTYISTNKLTSTFQSIIDGYGICRYKEVNPGIFTLVTFPFLFGIMFGDVGHASMLLFLSLLFIIYETPLGKMAKTNDILDMFFGARYMILLLSFFSLFCGVIYNDIFSLSARCVSSGWKIPHINESLVISHSEVMLDPKYNVKQSGPYMLGLDPIWHMSTNKLTFVNAMKMKISIILGVIHMIFGLCLSVLNHIHFKKPIYILLEFIPSLLYITCSFGYLVFLIFYKWIMIDAFSMKQPSLMAVLISMFMNPAEMVTPDNKLFDYQEYVEMFLLFLFVISIPWMLLGKPLYQFYCSRRSSVQYTPSSLSPSGSDEERILNPDLFLTLDDQPLETTNVVQNLQPPPHSFMDILIEQFIHVIEFCLGTFSHTASYLRLWALSLAHTALSDVLWDLVIKKMFSVQFGVVGVFVSVFVSGFWLILTTVVLVGMEGLSAFLHALRLHWVEFQSKFFHGDGHAFDTFTLDFDE